MTDAENAAIKRQVYFERVKNARADKVLSLLDDADKRIAELLRKTKGVETRKRYNEIAKAIKALAKSLRERIAEGLDTEEIIDSELDAQRKFITDFCGVKVDDFTLPTTGQVLTAAEFAPIVGSMTYQSYLDGIETGLFNAWDSAVRTGYLTGETTQSIVKRVLGSAAGNAKLADAGEISTLRNSVWRNTRTALQSFARETRDAVYEANADIFSGYKFLATLDKRTCPVCGALDGKIYKRLEDVPKVPLHYNCRCLAIPAVKGMDFSDTRASMNGQVDSKVTYEEWLRAQPEAVQKDVLGTTRYKLWRAGERLGGFVDNGRVMTVRELGEKMQSATKSIRGLDAFKALPDVERKAVLEDMAHVTSEQQELLAKYAQNMKADLHYKPGVKFAALYEHSTNMIKLDINGTYNTTSTLAGFKKNIETFLHESGHWLDYNALGKDDKGNAVHIRDKLPDLRKKVKSDILSWTNGQLKAAGKSTVVKSIADIKRLPWGDGHDLCKTLGSGKNNPKTDLLGNVSDIYGALTGNSLVGGLGHFGSGYWKGDMLERETIADFFAARGCGGEILKATKEHLPTAYKYFEDYIGGM